MSVTSAHVGENSIRFPTSTSSISILFEGCAI
jgi:hypothetical protein